jgi:GNAT superfamily N-acetyltransferase
MPYDQAFISTLRFEYSAPDADSAHHIVTAFLPSGLDIGQLLVRASDGVIDDVEVNETYQRKGVASAMLNYLREQGVEVEHDWGSMTPAGLGWAKHDDPQGGDYYDTHGDYNPYWGAKLADYNGWTNWETWNTSLMMDNDYDLYKRWVKMVENGTISNAQELEAWVVPNVLGPYNAQQIEDAREWNDIPEEERIDYRYEELREKSEQAADLVDAFGFGKDVSDVDPQIVDPAMVNWQEIWSHIVHDYELEEEELRLPEAWGGWRRVHGAFQNGDYVRTNGQVSGQDDRGQTYTVNRNTVGEVIWSDDEETIVIFSLESGPLGAHNIRVQDRTEKFTLVPRTRGTAPRRHR